MADEDPLQAAMIVRRGTTRLARRLRMERQRAEGTLLELAILAHLSRRGPMTPGELAAAERLQPQSLTRALARLERDGLASREPDHEDRRRSVLAVTEAGRAALARDMQQRDAWLAAAMEQQLTRAERELLRLAAELMDRLAETDEAGQAGQVPGALGLPGAEHALAGGGDR
jgi:DNA-binding MarR family transcriptional regulator